MNVGDTIKLKTLKQIKSEASNTPKYGNGIVINGSFINKEMRYMFGKEWKVSRHYNHERNTGDIHSYHFEIYDPISKFSWAFNEDWVDGDIIDIIDVDELFEEIEL